MAKNIEEMGADLYLYQGYGWSVSTLQGRRAD